MPQGIWKQNLDFDNLIDEYQKRNDDLMRWVNELHLFVTVKIPRWTQRKSYQVCKFPASISTCYNTLRTDGVLLHFNLIIPK